MLISEDRNIAHYIFINNVFGHFYSGIADWIRSTFYPRTEEVIISTHDKAVRYFLDRKKRGGHNYSLRYPLVAVDPMADFEPSDPEGRFLHAYSRYSAWQGATLYDPPIYKDDNVEIGAALSKYSGTIEINFFCSSVYETMDVRNYLFQVFTGLNRFVRITDIESYIIIPDEFRYYTSDNIYTGQSYQLNWDDNKSQSVLIKNINREKLTFPFSFIPLVRLTSLADGSEKYGGSGDEVSEHRLTATIEWEAHFPTFLVLNDPQHPVLEYKLDIDLIVEYKYFKHENIDFPVQSSYSKIYKKVGDEKTKTDDFLFDEEFNYFFSEEDMGKINNGEIIEINLEKEALSYLHLEIYGKYGKLSREFQWRLEEDMKTVSIFTHALSNEYIENDILKIVYYKD